MGALSYVCAESVICIKNNRFEVLGIPELTDISSCSVGGRGEWSCRGIKGMIKG